MIRMFVPDAYRGASSGIAYDRSTPAEIVDTVDHAMPEAASTAAHRLTQAVRNRT
jgi:hypothetical protein